MKRQAVITGLGIVSPIGVGVERFWDAALAGRSGITTPTLFDATKLPRECQIVGEVADFNDRDWIKRELSNNLRRRCSGRNSHNPLGAIGQLKAIASCTPSPA